MLNQMDAHIRKVDDVAPSGNPDPNDPNQDPVKKWIAEVKAAIKNLRQKLKRCPNNETKQEPLEAAIKRGEDALRRWGQEP